MRKAVGAGGIAIALLFGGVAFAEGDDRPVSQWQNTTPSGVTQSSTVSQNQDSVRVNVSVTGSGQGRWRSPGTGIPPVSSNPPRPGGSGGSAPANASSTGARQEPGAADRGTDSATRPDRQQAFIPIRTTRGVFPVPLGGLPASSPPAQGGPTTAWVPQGPVVQIDPWAVAAGLAGEARLPGITLKVNPEPGVVAVPSWFWVDGYRGDAIEDSTTVEASHTECRLVNGEPECRLVDDSVTVELRLEPAEYTWEFGDGGRDSRRTFRDPRGLGRPYTDPNNPSPVAYAYEFSSYGRSAGFPIRLTVEWAAAFRANGGPWEALPPVRRTYDGQHVVEQVQPLRVAPQAAGGTSQR